MSAMMQPQDLASLLSSAGGQPGGQQQSQSPGQGNWLVDAINAVHSGMIEEADPQIVSMLGAVLNQLTTVQAKKVPASGQNAQPQQGQ